MIYSHNKLKEIFFIVNIWTAIFIYLRLPQSIWAQIIINEILPDPNSGADLIELVAVPDENQNLHPLNLEDYSLWDKTGEIDYQTQNQLQQGEFRVISLSNRLNKGGDTITLKKNKEIIDQFTYTSSQPNQSWWRYSLAQADFKPGKSSLGKPNPGAIMAITPQPTPINIPTTQSSPTIILTQQPTATIEPNGGQTIVTPTEPSLTPKNIENKTAQYTTATNIWPTINYLQTSLTQRKKKQKLKLSTQHPVTSFSTTLTYAIDHPSNSSISSVIIGGLCLIIASWLLYEN